MKPIHVKHETHKEVLLKFTFLVFLVAAYFAYLVWEHGLEEGGIVLALTWSFFVLCTPVADAGFLLDFPIRLLFGVRMIVIEIFVWALAILINILTLLFSVESYEITLLTSIFHKILATPFPYWSIILLCGLGTFLSIYFGDEMMDVVKHKHREKYHKHGFLYRTLVVIVLFILIVFSYYHLLDSLGVHIT